MNARATRATSKRAAWALSAAFAFALAGCDKTPCDEALDRLVEADDACATNVAITDWGSGYDCSDEDAQALTRQADCVEAASCDALSGADPAAHRALSECVAGLTDPAGAGGGP